jgi:hypothetical protein
MKSEASASKDFVVSSRLRFAIILSLTEINRLPTTHDLKVAYDTANFDEPLLKQHAIKIVHLIFIVLIYLLPLYV